MTSKKIIIRTPNNYPICDQYCEIERGQFLVVMEKQWKEICDFFSTTQFSTKNKKYWTFLDCDYYNASEFIKDCEIVCNDPSEIFVNFMEEFDNHNIIDGLTEIMNKYNENGDEENSD